MPEPVAGLVDYQPGGIVSRILKKTAAGSVTLFAFDGGQELSEHTTPFEALLHVVEGEAEVRVGAETARVRAGEKIDLPANVPHAVRAPGRFKMLLTMLRG